MFLSTTDASDDACSAHNVHDENEPPPTNEVFLGGTCGESTWRQVTAIPLLEQNGVTFFNPQFPPNEWHEGLIAVERKARDEATVELFIIDGTTRGVAAMVEAASRSSSRRMVLFVEDVAEGAVIDGEAVTQKERKDLNRGRAYLRDVVAQKDGHLYSNVNMCTAFHEASMTAARYALEARQAAKNPYSFKRKASL